MKPPYFCPFCDVCDSRKPYSVVVGFIFRPCFVRSRFCAACSEGAVCFSEIFIFPTRFQPVNKSKWSVCAAASSRENCILTLDYLARPLEVLMHPPLWTSMCRQALAFNKVGSAAPIRPPVCLRAPRGGRTVRRLRSRTLAGGPRLHGAEVSIPERALRGVPLGHGVLSGPCLCAKNPGVH